MSISVTRRLLGDLGKAVHLAILFLICSVGEAKSSKVDLEPILPTRAHGLSQPKMLVLEAFIPEHLNGAGLSAKEAQKIEKRLKKAIMNDPTKKSLLLKMRQDALTLVGYYWRESDEKSIHSVMASMMQITENLSSHVKGKEEVDNLFFSLTARLVMRAKTTPTMEALTERKDLLSEKQLEAYEMIYNYRLMGSKYTYEKGEKGLRKVVAGSRGPNHVLALLYLSSGYTKQKGKIGVKPLKEALFKSFERSQMIRTEVTDIAIGLFEKRTSRPVYKVMPMAALKSKVPHSYVGLKERLEIDRGAPARNLIPFYKDAAKLHSNGKVNARIDRRLNKLYSMEATSPAYLAFLDSMMVKYDRSRKSDIPVGVREENYRVFLGALVGLAKDRIEEAKKDRSLIKPAVAVVNVIIDRVKTSESQRIFKAKLASLYELAGLYEKSNGLYLELSAKYKDYPSYLQKAFKNQISLAGWKTSPPWLSVPLGKNKKRLTDLLGTAETLYKQNPDSLIYGGHVALIKAALGKNKEAVALILKATKDLDPGKTTQIALSGAAKIAEQNKDFDGMIAVAKQAMSLEHKALYDRPKVSFIRFLSDAMAQKADLAYKNKSWGEALKTYYSMISLGGKVSSNREDNFLRAIESARKLKKTQTALVLTSRYLKEFPESKERANTVRWAARSLAKTKDFKKAIAFIRMGLQGKLPVDDDYSLHLELASHYGHNMEYVKEKNIYVSLMNHKKLSMDRRAFAAFKAIDMDRKYGNIKESGASLKFLKSIKTRDEALVKRIALVEASYVIAHKRLDQFPHLVKKLSPFAGKDKNVDTVLGVIRYVIAERASARAMALISKPQKIGPVQLFNGYKKTLLSIKKNYDSVCFQPNPQCAAAKMKIKSYADRLNSRLASLSFPANLPAGERQALRLYRQEVMTYIGQIGNKDYSHAVALAKQGKTNQSAKEEILYYQAH